MFRLKSGRADSRIGSQNIVYVIKSLVICSDLMIFHTERKLVSYLYIRSIIFWNRSLETAFRAFVITKLAIMIKTVL